MSNEPMKVDAPESLPTSRLTVSKDQAASLKIGQTIRMEVIGEIKEIARCYNDKESYDIVIEDPKVKSVEESEEEKADDEKDSEDDKKDTLATIPKEELKKLISKEF
jgi:hypothetical protein